MEAFATEHDIPFERCGKLVVALDDVRARALRGVCASGPRRTACPVSRSSGPERMRELEPHAAGIKALWSPSTGIIDYRRVALAYRRRGASPRRRDPHRRGP